MLFRPQHPRIAREQDASWERHGDNHYARMLDAYALCSKLIREANEFSLDSYRLHALVGCWSNPAQKKFLSSMIPNPATIEDARNGLDALIREFKLPAPEPVPDEGNVVVTKDENGHIVAVTRQDEEGKILSVIAESTPHKPGIIIVNRDRPVEEVAAFLIEYAEYNGKVVTITTVPNMPPRTGDYKMVADVRVARSVYGAVPIEWFRVVRGSNFDDAMVSEEWASECLSKENAETRCKVLNEKCSEHSRDWHSVRPETYTLYEFQP